MHVQRDAAEDLIPPSSHHHLAEQDRVRRAVGDVSERAEAIDLKEAAVIAVVRGKKLILVIVVTHRALIAQQGRTLAPVRRSSIGGADQRPQVLFPELANERAVRAVRLVRKPRVGEPRRFLGPRGNPLVERPLLDHREDRDHPAVGPRAVGEDILRA